MTQWSWDPSGWPDNVTFFMHAAIYGKHSAKLLPFIGSCEKTWEEVKGQRFLVLFCAGKGPADALLSRLKSIGVTEKRKARLENAAGHHLKEHYRVLWDIQRGRCYFSGEEFGRDFGGGKFSVDHLIPLSTTGTDWPTNLALVTVRINNMKGNRWPNDFLSEVKRKKSFSPTPSKERRRIDNERKKAFYDFMCQHCSDNEDDWH